MYVYLGVVPAGRAVDILEGCFAENRLQTRVVGLALPLSKGSPCPVAKLATVFPFYK